MIKPIKLVNEIIAKTGTTVEKQIEKITNTETKVTEDLPLANADLLRTYQGVKVQTKRLFQDFGAFTQDAKTKLEEFKETVPENLYKELKTAADNNNFSFSKILANHYAGLNECKTVAEAKKLFPEIQVFDTNFEKTIAEDLKSVIPESLYNEVKNHKTLSEKIKLIEIFFETNLNKRLMKWDCFPKVKEIQDEIALEMAAGKFKGTKSPKSMGETFTYKEPLEYRFINEPNREEAILNILRDNYINGNSYANTVYKTVDGREVHIARLFKQENRFSGLDGQFLNFLKYTEKIAQEFANLGKVDKSEISSAIMTQTWKTSRLRADLGNETAYKKDWSLIKPVWQKTMFPDTTYYPTDKLIDTYLVSLFKNGKRSAETTNPIAKHEQVPHMDKSKIMLLKRLYKMSKVLDMDKNILNSTEYKTFKAEFDLDAMKKSIESIEEHYKNSFFKRFWTDERRTRFATALNENREIANKNIEISDHILTDALNSVFSES